VTKAARRVSAARSDDPPEIAAFFASRGWKPFAFQREVWAAMRAGSSGLLHATTGAGKTLAVGFGAWLAARGKAPHPNPLPGGEREFPRRYTFPAAIALAVASSVMSVVG